MHSHNVKGTEFSISPHAKLYLFDDGLLGNMSIVRTNQVFVPFGVSLHTDSRRKCRPSLEGIPQVAMRPASKASRHLSHFVLERLPTRQQSAEDRRKSPNHRCFR